MSQYITGQYEVCFQCLFNVIFTVKSNIIKKFKFYYNSLIKILGVLGAYSHFELFGLILLFFLQIFVKKHFVKLSSNENAQLIVLYAVNILTNIMLLMCPNSNGNMDVQDQYFNFQLMEKIKKISAPNFHHCLLQHQSLC